MLAWFVLANESGENERFKILERFAVYPFFANGFVNRHAACEAYGLPEVHTLVCASRRSIRLLREETP